MMAPIKEPHPYQERLAREPWPDFVHVPTGLGKTAAVSLAWMYKRLWGDEDTPRRLIWCLPMRVLVEQTRDAAAQWLERARPLFEEQGLLPPQSYVLMGGAVEEEWIRRPEAPAVIIGTQDMLLSRALMRGFGVSRYRWPVDFALVHHDALWVYDEVQLMGPGLATSAQLEAFRRRRDMATRRPARSLWLSATLRSDWLHTVDFVVHVDELQTVRLSEEEKLLPGVRRRRHARKTIEPAPLRLEGGTADEWRSYARDLAVFVLAKHEGDGPTLVICNSVDRAQMTAEALQKELSNAKRSTELLLVHARFRAAERDELNRRLRGLRATDDVIVVATQAVEAGVDMTSRRLVTELAPWSSLVQRFGRCNRGGEYSDAERGGEVYWIDLGVEQTESLALPYDVDSLVSARERVRSLSSAAPADLSPVDEQRPLSHVLRRKDFLELFNTDPDLSGHDVDISHFVRDSGTPQLHVFWRDMDGEPSTSEEGPRRDELCPVSVAQLRRHLQSGRRSAFVWDGVSEAWRRLAAERIRPGQTVLLPAAEGGYDKRLGFLPRSRGAVDICRPATPAPRQDALSQDPETQIGAFVTLAQHTSHVVAEMKRLCEVLEEEDARGALLTAAWWHDVGKAHGAAQTAYRDFMEEDADEHRLWAKTPYRERLRYRVVGTDGEQSRRYFRHELASALAWLHNGSESEDRDLIAYLIVAHHGKVRLGLRAVPNERGPREGRRFARGVWEGDTLPPVELPGLTVPETTLRLDVMEMGEGPMGPSWTARTRSLLRRFGPFRLAWLEAVLRLADWRASAREQAPSDEVESVSHSQEVAS